MVNWDLAKEDSYYRARRLEKEAREAGTSQAWGEFAFLKAQKGSYVLAAYGFFNAALACEQTGDIEQAFFLYPQAFKNARCAGSKELALMVAYRHALLAEKAERWELCISVFEALGAFAEELGSHFLAADAYEHAAEIMVRAGKPLVEYTRPIGQWKENAAYWREQGHEDDAAWSERHIALYKALFEVRSE
jgi:hypothetical protein